MFIDVRELSAGAAGGQVTDATTAGIAVRDLGQLYKGLLAAVKEEALVMEQVSPENVYQTLCSKTPQPGGFHYKPESTIAFRKN